jgi:toxin ParE1/3/4
MTSRLHYSPEALSQLDDLETYLVERAGSAVADGYLDRLLGFCDQLATEPIVGHARHDLVPGLMTRIFEKNRVVCFLLLDQDVHIIAIYGGRQDWERYLHDNPPTLP